MLLDMAAGIELEMRDALDVKLGQLAVDIFWANAMATFSSYHTACHMVDVHGVQPQHGPPVSST